MEDMVQVTILRNGKLHTQEKIRRDGGMYVMLENQAENLKQDSDIHDVFDVTISDDEGSVGGTFQWVKSFKRTSCHARTVPAGQ